MAEAYGLGISWAMVQANYMPNFSSLSGTVFEISANVTFCDILWHHAGSSHFALGGGRGLRPRHIMGHGSSYLRAKIQLSKSYGLWDISKCHVFMSRLWRKDTQTDVFLDSCQHQVSLVSVFCTKETRPETERYQRHIPCISTSI